MIGLLFLNRVSPSEIKSMTYPEMKYWRELCDVIADAKKKVWNK